MKAVKLKLYQNLVNYRKEMSYGYVQTYPLPTPSMARGMAHALLELKEYRNLKISIQGEYDSVVTNMQKIIKFDRKDRHPQEVYFEKVAPQSVNYGVMFVDEIVDMNLLLHIRFDEEELNERFLDAVKTKTVILGRNEDIARLDMESCKIVKLEEVKKKNIELKHNIFLDLEIAEKERLSGPVYRLPFLYLPVKSFEDKRIFKFVNVMYVAEGRMLNRSKCLFDDDGDIVSFSGVKNDD